MLANSRKVKYKNDTSQILTEVARRMNVNVKMIQKPFQCYWQDVGTMFTHNLGYGINIEGFCHMIMYVQGADTYAKKIEKRIKMLHRMLEIYHEKTAADMPEKMPEKIKNIYMQLYDYLTRIVLLQCSLNQYEKDVLAIYPKKYKPRRLFFDQLVSRLEKLYRIPISEFTVQISHPIQEVFVRKLQKKGVLPNPVVYKDQEMQPMQMYNKVKNSLSSVQLPAGDLDKTN